MLWCEEISCCCSKGTVVAAAAVVLACTRLAIAAAAVVLACTRLAIAAAAAVAAAAAAVQLAVIPHLLRLLELPFGSPEASDVCVHAATGKP